MTAEKPGMLQPALIGGAFMGVTSALPVVELLNCLCCALVIGGGVLAVHFYLKDYPPALPPPEYGDGALLGLLSGAIGTVVCAIVSIPFYFLGAALINVAQWEEVLDDPQFPPELARLLREIAVTDVGLGVQFLMETVCFLGVALAFGTLGGILGIAILKKSPPPPQEPVQAAPPAPPPPAAPGEPQAPPPPTSG